jgi:tetratricopeptide (TPR) repeat protein
MKQIVKNSIVRFNISLLFLLFNLAVWGQENSKITYHNDKSIAEYYYAFTEATKQTIYGDFYQAMVLYKKCLEYNPASAAIKYQLSKIYFRLGEFDNAKYFGVEAVKNDYTNRWYIMNIVSIYQYLNNIDSAIYYNRKLANIEPYNVNVLLNLALLYQINGKSNEALVIYHKIEADYGKFEEVFFNRYKIFYGLGKYRLAVNQLHEARLVFPDDYKIIGMLAEHFRDINRNDSAEYYYNLLFNISNIEETTIFSYVDFLLKNNQIENACNKLKLAFKSKEVNKEEIIGYLNTIIQQGNYVKQKQFFFKNVINLLLQDDSIDFKTNALFIDYSLRNSDYSNASGALKKLLIHNEDNYLVWEKLLYSESEMNKYDTVIKYGKKAVKKFENKPLIYFYTGLAYNEMKDYYNAINMLEEGIKFTDNNNLLNNCYVLLGNSYNNLKNNEKTIEYYEKALLIDSSNLLVRNNYAYYLAEMERDLSKALRLSKYTISKDKNNVMFIDTYAWILFKMKEIGKAKYFINKAIKYGGNSNTEILLHYEMIYRKGNKGTK